MNSPFSEPSAGAFGPALSLAPLPDSVAARRSGPPRDFNCFCVFCNQAADPSLTRPPRTAAGRSR
ncbi:hypothetical protein ACFQ7B_42315 [Streptomyces erythrochromogenes]|uniref:hypothetical protein n=1 Tax=Streptomyces erythrochromogenes TaxID=285574 RepID=UPI00367635D3